MRTPLRISILGAARSRRASMCSARNRWPATPNRPARHAPRPRPPPGRIVEGFHYQHHPVNIRLRELVTSGILGDIRSVDLVLTIPAPPDADPRWSRELAGGATMDLGCYVLDAGRQLGL